MPDAQTPTGDPSHGQAYGQWKAPKTDGALLIWPDAHTLADLARKNQSLLNAADHVLVGGVALPELRRSARGFVGHHDDTPLIATGHQCELHHPGVWVKNVLIAAVAEAGRGSAFHFGVDTDAPKHLKLKWPGFAAPISDDVHLNGAAWTGLLDPPTPEHLDRLLEAAGAAVEAGTIASPAFDFLESCRAYLIDQRDAIAPLNLPAMTSNAQHQLDWSLGVRYFMLLLSGMLQSQAWLRFVCHMAGHAPAFARAYNAALAAHRREAGISGPDRPMPDLTISDDAVELPLWLDHESNGQRERATLRRGGGEQAWVLESDGEAFEFTREADPTALLQWLRPRRLRLAPRALSLTIFLRLCVCDLFIHGIGGGHYDQVSDRLIRDYFGIKPPEFAVATATLFHPAAVGRERVCPPCMKQKGHHLAHRVLGEEKGAWLEKIDAAEGFHARREIFDAMHARRKAAMADDPAFGAWEREMKVAQRLLAEEAEVFDRELFYAVQPTDRLDGLINRVREEIGGRLG